MKENRIFIFSLLVFLTFFVSSCADMTTTQRGAVGGAAVGVVAGQIIGGNTTGTLIGAGVGALGGALMNDALENERKKQ